MTSGGRQSGGSGFGGSLAACRNVAVVAGLMGASADGTQLGTEGTDLLAVAIPPALGADRDTYPSFGGEDGEGTGPEHEASALEAVKVGAPTQIVDVEKHCTGVRCFGVSDHAG